MTGEIFLCGTPANDYIFQKDTYEYRIDRAVEYIRNADCILIGAGAGASTAAGISMGGKDLQIILRNL